MNKKETIRSKILRGTLGWGCALALWLAAIRVPGFAETYVTTAYPVLVRIFGGLFSLVPTSVVEILLYVMIFSLSCELVRVIRRICCRLHEKQMRGESGSEGTAQVPGSPTIPRILGSALTGLYALTGTLILLYMVGCGINYHCRSFVQREEIQVEAPSPQDLLALCLISVQEVNRAAEEMNLQEPVSLPENAPEIARSSVQKLGDTYDSLSGYYPLPKKLMFPVILSVQQVTGVYSPFTYEANVNGAITGSELAFTYCHELAHLKGFMREDEANFIAWLACRGSDSAEFRYAAALECFIYAGNELNRLSPEVYRQVRALLCPAAEQELRANREFWDHYDGKAAEVHEEVNDVYLKVNRQAEGVRSYGRVVDLMIAWMKAQLL